MSELSILSYLHYLRDVNRKLIQRGGLDNTLYRKSSKKNPYYIELDASDVEKAKHFLNSLRYIQRSNALGLPLNALIGLGLIIGRVEVGSRVKYITAPLMFCNAELVEDLDNPNKIDINVFWDSCTLNYDFITTMLGQNRDEDINLVRTNSYVEPEILARFSEVEDQIDQIISRDESEMNLVWISSIMKYIAENVKLFSDIKLKEIGHKFLYKDLEQLIQKQNNLMFIPHKYFFISPAVGELTTVTSLNLLIKQLET